MNTDGETLTFYKFAKLLRDNFPSDRPISIKRTQTPLSRDNDGKRMTKRIYGDVSKYEDKYIIRLNKDDTLAVQKDTLMHEWAHILAGWDDSADVDSHTNKWGIYYAKVYRFMIGD